MPRPDKWDHDGMKCATLAERRRFFSRAHLVPQARPICCTAGCRASRWIPLAIWRLDTALLRAQLFLRLLTPEGLPAIRRARSLKAKRNCFPVVVRSMASCLLHSLVG